MTRHTITCQRTELILIGPLCESWTLCLTEPADNELWDLCLHNSCWAIATGVWS